MPNDEGGNFVLAQNEYLLVKSAQTGRVQVYVGPQQGGLQSGDVPGKMHKAEEGRVGKFEQSLTVAEAIQRNVQVGENSYAVLENPAEDGLHPEQGATNVPTLDHGNQVKIRGPVSFALWPGQFVRVIQGHDLKYNEYLLLRVRDEQAARENWGEAVLRPAQESEREAGGEKVDEETKETAGGSSISDEGVPNFTTGQRLIVTGDELSFFIPPTGVEVVQDESGNFVRKAVTLESIEYCILRDEDGNRRYEHGPAVVFPKPTETFVVRNGRRVFRDIELNPQMALHIKVIESYTDEGDVYHEAGEELFITGEDQKIYAPRPEHAIIKHGDGEFMHFAVAVPEGDGRYVLEKGTGRVETVRGPQMFLADPRNEVGVLRVIPPEKVRLWFPGNDEAEEVNRRRAEEAGGAGYVEEKTSGGLRGFTAGPTGSTGTQGPSGSFQERPEEFAGAAMERREQFTPPRMITLDKSKYDGAVVIRPYPGYAVQVVKRTGGRRVVTNPDIALLDYDETLEVLDLSTGTPKSDDIIKRTVYLQYRNLTVSDVVTGETSDSVEVNVHLTYKLNFREEQRDRWFEVENYTQFLTDHMRSMIRSEIKRHGIEDFWEEAADIIRNLVLGEKGEDGDRPGREFDENGMHIYEVDVYEMEIGDAEIARKLSTAQHESVEQTLEVRQAQKRLETTQRTEQIQREIKQARHDTLVKVQQLEDALDQVESENERSRDQRRNANRQADLQEQGEVQEILDSINESELARERSEKDLAIEVLKRETDITVESFREQIDAVSGELVAAMNADSDSQLAQILAENLPKMQHGGMGWGMLLKEAGGIIPLLQQIMQGSGLEDALQDYTDRRKQSRE